ncbi:hypothetical protein B0H14DRAFT_2594278 [Mycena olivaceomarginata]|nr:hypothetical protein B0H14DRAFT_2594278 [Mycena olivaceomarginata]
MIRITARCASFVSSFLAHLFCRVRMPSTTDFPAVRTLHRARHADLVPWVGVLSALQQRPCNDIRTQIRVKNKSRLNVRGHAPPCAEPLPVTTIIPDKDVAVDFLKNLLEDEEFANPTWFTDGSLLEEKAGGAAIRLERGKQCGEILIPLGEGQVMEGEVEGLLWTTERALAD